MTATTAATVTGEADWNNDGDYSDSTEDITAYMRVAPGLRIERGRDQIQDFAPALIPAADCELDNQSKRFSAEYAGSPIFGYVTKGPAIRYRADIGEVTAYNAAIAYNQSLPYNGLAEDLYLFNGNIDEVVQYPSRLRRAVGVGALGKLGKLRGRIVSTQLYEDISTAEAAVYLFTALGMAASEYSVNTGSTMLEYWWLDEEDAFDALNTLVATEGAGGAAYERADGVIIFEGRGYRSAATRSITSQQTFRDASAAGSIAFKGFGYYAQPGQVINEVKATVKRRTVAGVVSKVWELGFNGLSLGASETKAFAVSASDPFKEAVAPVAATDYAVSAGSLTSVTLSRASGQNATLTLVAGAGGATIDGVTSTGIQVRAKPVTVLSTTVVTNGSSAATTASIARSGTRSLSLGMRGEVNANSASSLCDTIVTRYRQPRPTVEITLINATFSHLHEQMFREIGDRITIIEEQTGVSAAFWIEKISHVVRAGGKIVETIFGCEKVATDVGGTYDVATYDVSLYG